MSVQAQDLVSDTPVVVKLYNTLLLAPLNRHQMLREIQLHGAVAAHSGVVCLYAAFQVWRKTCATHLGLRQTDSVLWG
jgi:hypothetical protein